MFYQNKKRHNKILGRSKLTAALKAEVILADSKRRDFILQIQNALGFESIRFQQLIQPLLNQIAENYQLFPSNEHRFYALPGGLLDYALYRAQAAMYIFRQSILPPDTKTLSESQALWAYVLLTAALLRGSGVLYTHYQVECFDDQGHSTGFWKPLDEDFFSTTPFYTLENHFDYPEGLSEFLTLFLAKR